MKWLTFLSRDRKTNLTKRTQPGREPLTEKLEERRLLAFSVSKLQVESNPQDNSVWLVADFKQPVNAATVQAADLVVDRRLPATATHFIDVDTVAFRLPSLPSGKHSASIAAGAIQNVQGKNIHSFFKSFAVKESSQDTIEQRSRHLTGKANALDTFFANQFSAAATTSLTNAFQSIGSSATWPVSGTTLNEIESTFGPRVKVSTSGYDWHRGIDIDAVEFTPVVAPVAGTLFDVKNYTDGGLTVILKHSFPQPVLFAGKTLSSYYTFYMHLSSVDSTLQAAASAQQTPSVPQGFQIGKVGHSGTAVGDHLHWEIRVGTPYSLEWQLANPTSQYGANNFGFDPHVHPMLLTVPTATNTLATSLTTKPTSSIDGRVRITTDDEQPLLNRVEVKIVSKSTNSIVSSHMLDLNERIGFDATTNSRLDTPDKTKPYFVPISFGTSAANWSTDLVIPKAWVGKRFGTKFLTTVTITDIWGRTRSVSW